MKYLLLLFFLLPSTQVYAQSACSSDRTKPVKSISERFISADCANCWIKPVLTPNTDSTLDWLAPSPAGEDAPLAAAANRDALTRLEYLKISLPKEQEVVKTSISPSSYKIRVAHGLPIAGYIGASIALTNFPTTAKNLTAVLLVTETIPKGTADSPIERTLVRNMLIEPWSITSAKTSAKSEKKSKQVVITRRPLSIPQGVNPDNLHVFGWVQDENGLVLAAAQSFCSEAK
jgi:hypothetical protein